MYYRIGLTSHIKYWEHPGDLNFSLHIHAPCILHNIACIVSVLQHTHTGQLQVISSPALQNEPVCWHHYLHFETSAAPHLTWLQMQVHWRKTERKMGTKKEKKEKDSKCSDSQRVKCLWHITFFPDSSEIPCY